MPTSSEEDPPPLVCIVDTSVLIKFKDVVSNDDQWDFLDRMLALVRNARLAFPRQVHREMAHGDHPDAPGVWCGRAQKDVQFPQPSDETMAEVLRLGAGDLIDANAEPDHETADPYVAAMAFELARATPPFEVVVATEDRVDRMPRKIALATACARLGLACWDLDTLLRWVADTSSSDRPSDNNA